MPTHSAILSKLTASEDCLGALTAGEPSVLNLLPGLTGVAVVWRDGGLDRVSTLGEAPPVRDIAALANWVRSSSHNPVFACDCVSSDFPPAIGCRGKASGILALQLDDARQPMLIFFRSEIVRPEKQARPNGEIEAKRNACEAWRAHDISLASDFLHAVNVALLQDTCRRQLRELEAAALEASRAKTEFLASNRRLAAQNRALHAAKAATEASNRELEAFSYSVAHDLRSPLRSIDGFCQILEEDYADRLDDTARDYLCRVRRAAQHMAALIEDLLRLARITQGEMSHSMVNLSELAAQIRDELRESAPARLAEFTIMPDIVTSGDPRLLRVVLENLLTNAWKFTGSKSVAKIEFGAEEKDGQTVLYVRDNGVGFEMAYAGRLFRAFQRLHGVHEFPGTGIGLATVQRIVAKHGGRIWAEASPGKGATFRFLLCDPGAASSNDAS